MMIDDAALNALEAKARAATPGPWHWNMNSRQLCSRQAGITLFRDVEWWNGKIAEDAAYIAALNPVVAVALIARIRELEAERDIVKRFMAMVWRWCNRPNVTDAERISFIRHHPTLEKWVEPPDDAYRDGVPEAARISKEAADA